MPTLYRAVASLRLWGDDLVPDDVTALLGTEPVLAYARGDELQVTKTAIRISRFGHWSIKATETSPADVDAQVQELLSRVSGDLGVWAQLAAKHQVDFFCGWFMQGMNEGIGLAPRTLSALGERGIELSVDLYGR